MPGSARGGLPVRVEGGGKASAAGTKCRCVRVSVGSCAPGSPRAPVPSFSPFLWVPGRWGFSVRV